MDLYSWGRTTEHIVYENTSMEVFTISFQSFVQPYKTAVSHWFPTLPPSNPPTSWHFSANFYCPYCKFRSSQCGYVERFGIRVGDRYIGELAGRLLPFETVRSDPIPRTVSSGAFLLSSVFGNPPPAGHQTRRRGGWVGGKRDSPGVGGSLQKREDILADCRRSSSPGRDRPAQLRAHSKTQKGQDETFPVAPEASQDLSSSPYALLPIFELNRRHGVLFCHKI